MSDVTRILSQIERRRSQAAEQLLPLVYDELRKLAAAKMAQEKPGQTLQATALVHEAYIRLVDVEKAQRWNSRGHFFAAAAEAMRRILVEQCPPQGTARKHGGDRQRVDLDGAWPATDVPAPTTCSPWMRPSTKLARSHDPAKAELVKLRFFAGTDASAEPPSAGRIAATAIDMGLRPGLALRRADSGSLRRRQEILMILGR